MPSNKGNKPEKHIPASERTNNYSSLYLILLITMLALMPFIYSNELMEPENSLRYFTFSVFILLFMLIVLVQKRSSELNITIPKGYLWLVLLMIFSGISIMWSYHPGEAFYEWTKHILQLGGMLLVMYALISSKETIIRLQWVAFYTLLIFTMSSGYQIYEATQTGNSGTLTIYQLIRGVHGTLSNKNFLGETFIMMLPILSFGFSEKNRLIKLVSIIGLSVALIMIFILQSSSVLFALFTMGITMFAVYFLKKLLNRSSSGKRKNPWAGIWMLVSVLILSVSGLWTLNRTGVLESSISKLKVAYHYMADIPDPTKITEQNDNSVYDRIILARASLKLIADQPLLGVGLSDWRIDIPRYGISGTPTLATGRIRFEHPHNEYLFIASESGLPGLFLWIMFLLWVLAIGFRYFLSAENNSGSRLNVLMLTCSVVAFMIISLFGYPRERFYSYFFLLLNISLIVFLTKQSNSIKISVHKFTVLFSFLFFIVITYTHAIRIKSEYHFKSALKHQFQKDFTGMIDELDMARSFCFKLDMTSTPVYWYQGMASYVLNNPQAAEVFYRKATKDNPYHIHAWQDLGSLKEKEHDYSGAITAYRHALEINPYFHDALYNMGVAQYNSGQIDSALYYLKLYPYKETSRFKKDIATILSTLISQDLRQTRDTVLMNILNDSIRSNRIFLVEQYLSVGEDPQKFREKIVALKP